MAVLMWLISRAAPLLHYGVPAHKWRPLGHRQIAMPDQFLNRASRVFHSLMGEVTRGAFQMNEVQSLSWFPCFNIRRGNYPSGSYSFFKLAVWCVALPIVNFFVLFAYYGAGFFAQIFAGAEGKREGQAGQSDLSRVAQKVVTPLSLDSTRLAVDPRAPVLCRCITHDC
jgi:hypothetical protein